MHEPTTTSPFPDGREYTEPISQTPRDTKAKFVEQREPAQEIMGANPIDINSVLSELNKIFDNSAETNPIETLLKYLDGKKIAYPRSADEIEAIQEEFYNFPADPSKTDLLNLATRIAKAIHVEKGFDHRDDA